MDKRNKKLIFELNKMCNSSYSVLEFTEIISKLPRKYSFDVEYLKKSLDYLQKRNYIDIKYYDEKEICLSVLPKSHSLEEDLLEERNKRLNYFKLSFFSAILSGLFAFAGAFLAYFLFFK